LRRDQVAVDAIPETRETAAAEVEDEHDAFPRCSRDTKEVWGLLSFCQVRRRMGGGARNRT
jgi:hypothetical protein